MRMGTVTIYATKGELNLSSSTIWYSSTRDAWQDKRIKKVEFCILDWPLKSPDSHLIELLLSILDKKLFTKSMYAELTRQGQLQEE